MLQGVFVIVLLFAGFGLWFSVQSLNLLACVMVSSFVCVILMCKRIMGSDQKTAGLVLWGWQLIFLGVFCTAFLTYLFDLCVRFV